MDIYKISDVLTRSVNARKPIPDRPQRYSRRHQPLSELLILISLCISGSHCEVKEQVVPTVLKEADQIVSFGYIDFSETKVSEDAGKVIQRDIKQPSALSETITGYADNDSEENLFLNDLSETDALQQLGSQENASDNESDKKPTNSSSESPDNSTRSQVLGLFSKTLTLLTMLLLFLFIGKKLHQRGQAERDNYLQQRNPQGSRGRGNHTGPPASAHRDSSELFQLAIRIDIDKKEKEEMRRQPWSLRKSKMMGDKLKGIAESDSMRGFRKVKRNGSIRKKNGSEVAQPNLLVESNVIIVGLTKSPERLHSKEFSTNQVIAAN